MSALPGFPIVYVTVSPDGSAHVNVTGRHVDFPAGDPEATRLAVLAYAVDVAKGLGRGVRVHSTEPDGSYKIGVHPGGTVEILDPEPARAKAEPNTRPQIPEPARATGLGVGAPPVTPPARPRLAPPASAPAAPPAPVAPAPAAAPLVPPPAPSDIDDPTVLIHRPTATLTFSTGNIIRVGAPAIIGRKPSHADTDWPGAQLVSIEDPERKVSRIHCAIAWRAGHLVVIDRGSTNGTAVTRGDAQRHLLDIDTPVELFDGDMLHLGTNIDVAIAVAALQPEAAR
ncbi:MAG: FHA domain-containing protein [Pseudolysinimonas sp.]|uniref:FHA domain-containing protein n=1 Tax=Pseudolysinimonas sp. TaxID=2680009 RepID=UPI003263D07B